MTRRWRTSLVWAGSALALLGVAVFIACWSLYTPEVIDQLEAGVPGDELLPPWNVAAAFGAVVVGALGVTAILIGAFTRPRERAPAPSGPTA